MSKVPVLNTDEVEHGEDSLVNGNNMETGEEESTNNNTEDGFNAVSDLDKEVEKLTSSDPTFAKKLLESPRKVINRQYNCKQCTYWTLSSKDFLFHQRDEHKAKFAIFLCDICDYASKWKDKVIRHREMIHKATVQYEELKVESPHKKPKLVTTLRIPKQTAESNLLKQQRDNSPSVERYGSAKPEMSVSNSADVDTETSEKMSFMSLMSLASKADLEKQKSETGSCKNSSPGSVVSTDTPKHPHADIDPDKHIQIFEEVGQEPQYQCTICNYLHPNRYQVKKHIKMKHINARLLKCPMDDCTFSTYLPNEMMQHRTAHPDGSMKCKLCDYSTFLRPNLTRHNGFHERVDAAYKCSKCNYGSNKLAAIHRHIDEHHKKKPGDAEIDVLMQKGSKTAVLKQNEVPDVKVKKGKKPRKKTVVPLSLVPSETNNENSNDSKLKQILLGGTITKKSTSRPSSPMTTMSENGDTPTESDDHGFLCDLCDQMFKRASDLDKHMNSVHSIGLAEYMGSKTAGDLSVKMTNIPATTSIPPTDESPLDLSIKHESPNHQSPTNNHSNEVKSDKAKTGIKCLHCPYIAKVPWDMKRHMAVHTPSTKRFYCQYCPRNYKYSGDLTVHMKRAHNRQRSQSEQTEREVSKLTNQRRNLTGDYICKTCGYIAKYVTELKKHNRTHTKVKPFNCEFCEYRTAWKGDLKRHLEKYHLSSLGENMCNLQLILNRCEQVVVDTLPGNESVEELMRSTPKKRKLDDDEDENINESELDLSFIKSEPLDDFPEFTMTPPKQNMVPLSTPSPNKRKRATPQKLHVDPEGNGCVIEVPDDVAEDEELSQLPASSSPSSDGKLLKNGNYVFCNMCSYKTTAPARLNLHMMAHRNLKLYKCTICGHRSNWMWDVAKHIKARHQRPRQGNLIVLSEEEAQATINDYLTHSKTNFSPRLKPSPDSAERKKNHDEKQLYEAPSFTGLVDNLAVDACSTTSSHSTTSSTSQPQAASRNLRRFKCSVCGHRSNWKWVIKKHLKVNHADEIGDIIHLSEEEALATLPPILTPGMKQSTIDKFAMIANDVKSEAPQMMMTAAPNQGADTHMPVTDPRNLPILKMPSLTKILQTTSSFSKPPTIDTSKTKRFKCSGCHYRSNYRSDIQRHVVRAHPVDGHVIVLSQEEAQATLAEYVATHSSGKYKPKTKKMLPVDGMPNSAGERATDSSNQDCEEPMDMSDSSSLNVSKDSIEPPNPYSFPDPQQIGENDLSPMENLVRHVESTGQEKKKVDLESSSNSDGLETTLNNSLLNKSSDREFPSPNNEQKVRKRIWKCSQCMFKHRDKTVVIRHLKSHAQNSSCAYSCALCGYASDYRSSVYRHLRTQHNATEYSTCKENILYTKDEKDPTEDESVGKEAEDYSKPPPPLTPSPGIVNIKQEKMSPKPDRREMPKLFKSDAVSEKPWRCKLCCARSNWRHVISRHIKELHKIKEFEEHMERLPMIPGNIIQKKAKNLSQNNQSGAESSGNESKTECLLLTQNTSPGKLYECNFCPYKTHKRGHMEAHKRFHYPRPGHEVKCLYCPYYATSLRVVGQHMKIHKKAEPNKMPRSAALTCAQDMMIRKEHDMMQTASSNFQGIIATPPGRERRYYECPQCPYVTRSKTDFLYHKQFHRKRTTGGPSFTCSKCDYCTTHRRFLTQHVKVHAPGYREQKILQYGDARPHQIGDSPTSSPTKSDISEGPLEFDPVELSGFKHDIIMSKMTSATLAPLPMAEMINRELPTSPSSSPEKSDKDPVKTTSNGTMRKLHRCTECPYTNIRLNNLRLHVKMHQRREGPNMFKCPQCEYYVGNKGLLAHHMKLHSSQYQLELPAVIEDETASVTTSEDCDTESTDSKSTPMPFVVKQDYFTNGHYVEPYQQRKYCCDKCPYGSTKKSQLEKHMHLHGSKQRHTCDFCDYSVPMNSLLTQHRKLHLQPNQNLLATQSLLNLSRLPELPADQAAAMLVNNNTFDVDDIVSHYYGIHDHLDLCENRCSDDSKKQYTCDRCPFFDLKREVLLEHLKYHIIRSENQCPYCDFSVPEKSQLTDHIQVHFLPLQADEESKSSDINKLDLKNNNDIENMSNNKTINNATILKIPKFDLGKDLNANVPNKSIASETQDGDQSILATEIADDSILDKSSDSQRVIMDTVEECGPLYLDLSGDENSLNRSINSTVVKEDAKVSNDSEIVKDETIDAKLTEVEKQVTNQVDTKKQEETVSVLENLDKTDKANMLENGKQVDETDKADEKDSNYEMKEVQSSNDSECLPIPISRETEAVDSIPSPIKEEFSCQYCERDFKSKSLLQRHEMQHLIGSHF